MSKLFRALVVMTTTVLITSCVTTSRQDPPVYTSYAAFNGGYQPYLLGYPPSYPDFSYWSRYNGYFGPHDGRWANGGGRWNAYHTHSRGYWWQDGSQ